MPVRPRSLAGRLDGRPDVLDPGGHRGQLDEPPPGDLADHVGQGGLPGAGRPPQHHGHACVVLGQLAQRRALAGQVPLADHLIQGARAHPHRQRRGRPGGLVPRRVEQAVRLAPGATCPDHTQTLSARPDRLARHVAGSGITSMPASRRCSGVIGVGAPVSGSAPDAAFGKAMTSRIVSRPASSMISRSQPKAMPPCGGGPKRSASSRKPNCDSASSRDSPITSKTCCCMSGRWIRIEPPPISLPLQTRS